MNNKNTAARKLLMLRPRAVLALMTCNLQMRKNEDLDPVELQKAAHELLELASQVERSRMRIAS